MESSFVFNSEVNDIKLLWSVSTESFVTAQPLVFKEKVFSTDWAGYAYCFDLASGKIVWKRKIYTPPSPKDSLLGKILGGTLPYLWFGLAGTGVIYKNIWYTASVGGKRGKPMQNGSPGKIYALDITTGKTLWQENLAPQPFSGSLATILAAEDSIFAGVCSVEEPLQPASILYLKKYDPRTVGEVIAYDPSTRQRKWSKKLIGLVSGDNLNAKGNAVWGGFAVDESIHAIFLGTGNNYGKPSSKSSDAFICLNSQTGAFTWQFQVVDNDTWLPVFPQGGDYDFGCTPQLFDVKKNGRIIKAVGIGNKNGFYYTFNRADGTMLWKTLCNINSVPEDGIRSNAQLRNERIYLWSKNKKPSNTICAVCLNVNDGSVIWSKILKGTNALGSGALSEKNFFIATFSGDIYALDIKNGNITRQINVPGTSIGSSLTIYKNMLIMGTGVPCFYRGKPANYGVLCFDINSL